MKIKKIIAMFATVAIISGIGGSVVMAAPKTEANLETVAISEDYTPDFAVSVPTEAKASEAKEQVILEENSESENVGQLISEKSYKDEGGNEITERFM